jgi:hypothetical protein
MSFKNAYGIADTLKAEIYEGVPRYYYFTPTEWYFTRTLQKWVLTQPDTIESRALSNAKIMEYPLLSI